MNWIVSHPETETLVAADPQDRPIGLLTISHRPQLRLKGRILTIDELVVSTVWRRRGVARELMKRAIERAKILSAKRLEIAVPDLSEEAKTFLKALGFTSSNASVYHLPK